MVDYGPPPLTERRMLVGLFGPANLQNGWNDFDGTFTGKYMML